MCNVAVSVRDVQEVDAMVDADLEEIKAEWLQEQNQIKSLITLEDSRDWDVIDDNFLVGGLDISFIVGNDVSACACYVVLNQDMEAVYTKTKMVEIAAPYVPGFLAFREAQPLVQLVREQMSEAPELTPCLLMVDGNGILHPNRAGVASHIGVTLAIPTIGVAKNLHHVQGLKVTEKAVINEELTSKGSSYDLATSEDEVLGRAVRTSEAGRNPVFVSVGTGISLESAVRLTLKYSNHRIPEPTRQADIISREYLRLHHPTARQIQPVKGQTNKQRMKLKQEENNCSDND